MNSLVVVACNINHSHFCVFVMKYAFGKKTKYVHCPWSTRIQEPSQNPPVPTKAHWHWRGLPIKRL